jgi:NAD(P)H-flavin reductase
MLAAVGAGEIPISISGDQARKDRLSFTIRAARNSSSALASRASGDAISMRGPLGSRWPLEESAGDDLLLIGGGMGLAALRPIVYAVMQDRPRFGRPTILCGARTPADLIYTPELAAWDRLSRTDVFTTVDAAGPSWLGHVGVATAPLDTIALRPANTTAMICGPDAMMRSTARDLNSRGLSDRRIFLSMASIREGGPIFSYSEVRGFDVLCERKAG